ncbi:ABC transporter permease [Streptococcus sp. SGI.013]|uniref:ABC transporter permease n=1 Tax=unclassified Streptococcus TaxID=2608887 RepID=UPI003D021FE9
MLDYFHASSEKLLIASLDHLILTVVSLLLALLLSSGLTLMLLRFPVLRTGTTYMLSLLYAVPSFALFALLLPFTGLGKVTAIVVLTLYAQYILVRTFLTGFDKVDASVLEAARGMGMDFWQILVLIQLPLIKSSIFSGLRLAGLSIVAIATIAATINAGGLGTILFDGLRTMSLVKLTWGILLSVGLSLFLSFVISLVEILFETPYSHKMSS